MKKVQKADQLWQQQLPEESYRVARCGGTEAPFSGKYNDCKDPGTYHCICCGQKLFASAHKYDSGSGWPSYWQPISPGAVTEHADHSLGMTRTEVTCSGCDAHLGHVFPDGPEPTGLRYCMNSASLQLKPEQ